MSEEKSYIEYENLRINNKEKAISLCRYSSFAKYCNWLLHEYSKGNNIFYVRDLCRVWKISYTSAYNFFENLINLGYAQKFKSENTFYIN